VRITKDTRIITIRCIPAPFVTIELFNYPNTSHRKKQLVNCGLTPCS